ncbi:MAG: T9SS type A sorting domain-containing protein [Bacteroidales bacterium]|nr:T9SS type A sorting domain-containing protein [Bacteroidales bacterium]
MKKTITILLFLLIGILPALIAQSNRPLLESKGISQSNVDVYGSPVVIEQVDIDAPEAGWVVVNFNGMCHPDAGDNIVLAASDATSWTVNDGNTSVYDERSSFSHTRVYEVNQGVKTFYAIAENYVNTAGNGHINIYGNLSAEYYPYSGDVRVAYSGISKTNIDLRGNPVELGQVTIDASTSGKVFVRFDGDCSPDMGDRIVLAASNTVSWGTNDGSVSVRNEDGTFSHVRVYDVNPGMHTFYAVGENYVNQGGNGYASVYGNLVAEFYPSTSNAIVDATGIAKSYIDLRGNPVALDSITVDPGISGTALVNFDGTCNPDLGDRIVLAASNNKSWNANDGNVNVDDEYACFSHSRAYAISQGPHSFYGVGENYVNQGGNGLASIYANLAVKFFPDDNTSVSQVENDNLLKIYPNPAMDELIIKFNKSNNNHLQIMNTAGQIIESTELSAIKTKIDISEIAAGVYYVRIQGPERTHVRKIIKQ